MDSIVQNLDYRFNQCISTNKRQNTSLDEIRCRITEIIVICMHANLMQMSNL